MISIIMPVYNARHYINQSIESVLNQTYDDWELIIVNDGSTDGSDEIIHWYKDPRIKCISQNNQGVSAARNKGLLQMEGEYFCFLDADDVFPPNSLESRHRSLVENSSFDFIDGSVEIFNKDLKKKLGIWQPSFIGNPSEQLLQISGSCFFSPSWMIRRKENRTCLFNENLTHGEDLLFLIERSLQGGIYGYVKETILHYRKGHDSAMQNLQGLEDGYRKIYRYLSDRNEITEKQAEQFKSSAKKIILKSYLGHAQPINALLSLLKKW